MTQTEGPVGYRTLIKRGVVNAIRAAFDANYVEDSEFTSLEVYPNFPEEKVSYPFVWIDVSGSTIRTAGVGHNEVFPDETGVIRRWQHRKFDGATITLNAMTLTPLSIDIVTDALVELFSFSQLNAQLLKFSTSLYGSFGAPVSFDTVLSQLTVHTDEIEDQGSSASPAPWGAEDQLVYSSSITVPISGGFYNRDPNDIKFFDSAQVFASPIGEEITYSGNNQWTFPNVYHDSAVVTSTFGFNIYQDRATITPSFQSYGYDTYIV